MHSNPPCCGDIQPNSLAASADFAGGAGGLPSAANLDEPSLVAVRDHLSSADLAALGESAAALTSIVARHVRADTDSSPKHSLSHEEIVGLSQAANVLSSLLSRRSPAEEEIHPSKSSPPRHVSLLTEAVAAVLASKDESSGAIRSNASMSGVMTPLEAEQLIDAYLSRTIQRVPIKNEKCPFSGMKRGQLYELFKLQKNGKPVVRNISLREKGEKHGARYYKAIDAVRYLENLLEKHGPEEPPIT